MTRHHDPEVREAFDHLKGTLARMNEKLLRIAPDDYGLNIRARVSPAMASAVTAYMGKHKIFNQAEAIRRLLAAGLAAEGGA